jgi:regulator of nucleoside diphosphate kinase
MQHNPCILTTKDYTILEVMLERCLGLDDPMRPILQDKLHNAVVVFQDDVPPTVVTLNSRVAYRVDGAASQTRIVCHDEMGGLVGRVISIKNPRGLALLGLAEGQSYRIADKDGSGETITVQEVVYQPEAARREAETLGRPAKPPFAGLRLVHSSDCVPAESRKAGTRYMPSPDDPGPSAA